MKIKIPVWIYVLAIILIDKIVKIFVLTGSSGYVINNGFVLGLASNSPWALVLSLVVNLVLLFVAWKYAFKFQVLWIILGAGLANLSDRFIWMGIVDYIQIGRLPVFNLADIILFVGIIVLIIQIILPSKWRKKKQ